MNAGPSAGSAEDEKRILAMLASGLPDTSIARQLGMSERTVQRRVARLQQLYGVQSRFQLGMQVIRQGLLE